jgi:hypothetical protein
MAPPVGAVPSTLDRSYLPTLAIESSTTPDEYAIFQSICFQEPYTNYCSEELRLADQARLPTKPKVECQFEKELKQKTSKVDQLQLQLQVEQFQQQLTPLREKHRQKASKLDILQHEVTAFKQQVERNASEVVQLQAKVTQLTQEKDAMNDTLDSTLKSRSEKMKTVLNKKVAESREALRAELLPLVESARREGRAEGLIAGRAEGFTEGQAQGRKHNELSDKEVREFLSMNPTVRGILAGNVKKKLEAEIARVEAEYEAKLKVYKLNLSGQIGKLNTSPTTEPLASASPVGPSKPIEATPAPRAPSIPAGDVQPSATQSTNTTAANNQFGTSSSPRPISFGGLAAPQTNAAFSAPDPLDPATIVSLKSSHVKATYPFDRSASMPPESSLPSQTLVPNSSLGLMKFTSSNIFGSSDTPIKNPFPSTANRAQSIPFEKPHTAATNSFGTGSPFQPSNTAKTTAIFATVGSFDNSLKATTRIFGSPGLSQSSDASKTPFFSASASPFGAASSNSIAPKPTTNLFGFPVSSVPPLGSNAFGLFAQKPVESKAPSAAIPSIFLFAPKDPAMPSSLIGNEVPKIEGSGQKRDREEDTGRAKDEVKKERVDETYRDTEENPDEETE